MAIEQANTMPCVLEHLRIALREDRPDLDPAPIIRALEAFARWRSGERSFVAPPSRTELKDYLASNVERYGDHAGACRMHHLQAAAPVVWGLPYAALIADVVRKYRCAPKPKPKSHADKVKTLIQRLPYDYQPGLLAKISPDRSPAKQAWSLAHSESVCFSLIRWTTWCERLGHSTKPTGATFDQYARDLQEDGVSARSVTDYLGRILSGYRAARAPGFQSVACEHVVSQLRARGKREGSPTKSGEQLVGASVIYNLGNEIIEGARKTGPRGLHQARDFRNGLLLAMAAAVPQRARAMSHYDIGRTVILLDRPHVRVRLPGSALKLREHEKANGGYDRVIDNAVLWDAIDEYHRVYRRFFDEGTTMFPSLLDIGSTISSHQIGVLTGNLTERHLGVRVSVHRVRDNVATEASEELQSGGYIAPALLDNKSAATTMASYDRAQGMRATREHGAFIEARRSRSAQLEL